VHLTAAAIWLGGLTMVCLAVLPRRRPDELAVVLPRYSALAFTSVAAVVLAGAFMSWQLVGGLDELVGSRYGHLLLLKVAMFALVLVVARGSKHWVDRRLDLAVLSGGHPAAVRPFVYSVAAEVVLAVSVVTMASLLVATNPAR
jgi:putative copper export protein